MLAAYDDFRPTRRERREQMDAERYAVLFELETARLIREYEEEGGEGYYVPDGAKVHRLVMQRMVAMKEEA